MSVEFDPYHKWLGIPPREQPPHHYRLLGIDLFETDPEVIDTAANRQMAFLQDIATGPHLRHSQRLLNELAKARLCLLNADRKLVYDASLKAKLSSPAPCAPAPVASAFSQGATPTPPPVPTTAAVAIRPTRATRAPRIETDSRPRRRETPRRRVNVFVIFAVGLVFVTLAAACAILSLMITRGLDDRGHVALADPREDTGALDVILLDDALPTDVGRNDSAPPTRDVAHAVAPQAHPESDIPPPGAYLAGDARNRAKDRPRSANRSARQRVMHEPIRRARTALEQNDIPLMIQFLEEFQAQHADSPMKPATDRVLGQARLATSDELVREALDHYLASLADDEVRRIAREQQIDLSAIPFLHDNLRAAFEANVQRNLPAGAPAPPKRTRIGRTQRVPLSPAYLL